MNTFSNTFRLFSFLLVGAALMATRAEAQQLRFYVSTIPDSAKIIVNGELKTQTPDLFYDVKRKSDSTVVELVHPGYKVDRFVVPASSKEWKFHRMVYLVPEYPFTIDSSAALITFDKMIVDFPSGKVLGKDHTAYGSSSELRWEGNVKVADERFEQRTFDVLGAAGFRTPVGVSTQLFSDETRTRKPSRYVLGAKLVDLWVEFAYHQRFAASCPHHYTIRTEVEWQVFDKSLNKVVLARTTQGNYEIHIQGRLDGDLILDGYRLALEKFLMEGTLADLVNEGAKKSPKVATSANGPANTLTLPAVKAQEFASNSEMISASTQACVTIETDEGHGSGFLVSAKGKILTAYHVVSGASRIEVILSNGVKFEAKIAAFDEAHDVALLEIPGSGYAVLPIGDSKALSPGSDAFTIGTPFEVELGQSVSKGIVSGKRKVEEIIYIQTDVSVSPGNSGGPLINSKGECVGIIQRKLVAMGVEGVGFALPIETGLKQLGISVE